MVEQVIRAEGISKTYSLRGSDGRTDTLRDAIRSWLKRPLGAPRPIRQRTKPFWALTDVNLEIAQGDLLGLVGRNGAGKSTFLKILSRITAPSAGRAFIRGRVASLLEVGTGFHPELSGRENIFLNATILGMRRREILQKFDAIVAFSGVEKFLDTPVKHYSSGMYVRLAFSVAAHVETEILLVDEVLTVGDIEFQRKCLGKVQEAAGAGRTVVLVSHNLGAVRNLCNRGVVFEGGRAVFDGSIENAVAHYERSVTGSYRSLTDSLFVGSLAEVLRFEDVQFTQDGRAQSMLDPLQEVSIELRGTALEAIPVVDIKISVFRDGVFLFSCHDTSRQETLRRGTFTSRISIPGDVFRPGRYAIGIGAASSVGCWAWGADVACMEFSENLGGRSPERSEGLVSIPYTAERSQS